MCGLSALKVLLDASVRPTQPALGEATGQLREKRDLTQEELATKARLTVRTLSGHRDWHRQPDLSHGAGYRRRARGLTGRAAKLAEKHE